MILIILLFILVGCGRNSDFNKIGINSVSNKKTDKIFYAYIHKFERHLGKKIKTSINFGKTKGNAGVCYQFKNQKNEININKAYWKTLIPELKQQLIDHELGHCELDRDHNDKHYEDTCPVSIMRSWAFNEWEIENCYNNTNHYIKELFK